MAKKNFDWALVPSFLAVLDAGSLMGAARKLGAQQPTLSRHVAELELQLGVPLFERTGRGVVPTAAALALGESAREMQAGASSLARKLAGLQHVTAGTVRVTSSQVAASYLLPRALTELQKIEPGICVEVVSSNAITNLLRREADIAVRMVRPTQSSLIARKLGEIEIVPCAHQSYLDRAGTPHRAQDLADHRLLGYDTETTLIQGFAKLGLVITREEFALRTDDHLAYGRLIASGAGIGFLAAYNLKYLPGVVPILPVLKIPPLPCWLAVHREIRSNLIVRRVFDFLADTLPSEIAG